MGTDLWPGWLTRTMKDVMGLESIFFFLLPSFGILLPSQDISQVYIVYIDDSLKSMLMNYLGMMQCTWTCLMLKADVLTPMSHQKEMLQVCDIRTVSPHLLFPPFLSPDSLPLSLPFIALSPLLPLVSFCNVLLFSSQSPLFLSLSYSPPLSPFPPSPVLLFFPLSISPPSFSPSPQLVAV